VIVVVNLPNQSVHEPLKGTTSLLGAVVGVSASPSAAVASVGGAVVPLLGGSAAVVASSSAILLRKRWWERRVNVLYDSQ
jgi:hypothetical protein